MNSIISPFCHLGISYVVNFDNYRKIETMSVKLVETKVNQKTSV